MLQQAVRRLWPSGIVSSVGSQAACTARLGLELPQAIPGEQKAASGVREAHFFVPSLFNDSEKRDSNVDAKQPMLGSSLLSTASMFGSRTARGHAASVMSSHGPSATRSFHALAPRPSLPAVKGLGLGLGLNSQQPRTGLPMQQTRSYGSEGELLGAAYLLTTDIMFWSGLIGAVVFRRNLIVMLLCTEIVMLACNMNFLFASAYLNDMTGVIMSITITTIAACETAIGLALCVTYFHIRSATDVEALNLLK